MIAHFYDIESLANVFTLCNYKPEQNSVDIYYLLDDPSLIASPDFGRRLLRYIHEKNKNFDGSIVLYDLARESCNRHLAKTFGLSDAYLVNDPKSQSSYPDEFRITCDTDPDFDDDRHPYLMGYNSYNYDTTMLAMYLYEVFPMEEHATEDGQSELRCCFRPTNAKLMRSYNDDLFLPRFKPNMPMRLACTWDYTRKTWTDTNYRAAQWCIRKNMLLTGRHIDVARLNEKQQHVGLKRLIGMLGGQILESEKLKIDQNVIQDEEELMDLLAYNVSDCVNLKIKVFDHSVYQGQFSLKRGLLQSYPELIYAQKSDAYAPDIRPECVRRDRLTIDSSSAQLATRSLCPYGHLKDIPVVSFLYPSKRKAEELGVPQVNVLDEARAFFYRNFQQPELRAKFDEIYRFYKTIEGKNFNESENYRQDYQQSYIRPENIRNYTDADTNMFYYNADGSPSSCFVTFSIGGIHGAEYNKALYEADMAAYEQEAALMRQVQALYPNPADLKAVKKLFLPGPDGTPVEYKKSQFLKSGKIAVYKDITAKMPLLFKPSKDKNGQTKINPKYVFTSADPTNHEDFMSYYPNLLRMMSAFYNEGLGYDRYAEIFDNKQKYGKYMKDKSRPEAERNLYAVQREGTKLILNSASGAADANFESNIRMNNTIISMRIIGQLFSWRIGQAQTIAGARIISTNTDGLFSVLEETLNNEVLERESRDIGVEIEPEPTFLISKDSNNRLEMNPDTGVVEAASGGTLACQNWMKKGPSPSKSLAHAAVIDWALTEYLVVAAMNQYGRYGDRYAGRHISLHDDFDDDLGLQILKSVESKVDKVRFLNMFQTVIASSPGSISYVFATSKASTQPMPLQHYNRIFIMKDDTPNTVQLHMAVAKQVTAAMKVTRIREHTRLQIHDPVAVEILMANGVSIEGLPDDKEATVKKVTKIEDDWAILIQNKDLEYLSEQETDAIISNLDYEKYLSLLRDTFRENWKNTLPVSKEPETDDDQTQTAQTGKPVAAANPLNWPPEDECPF